MNSLRDDILLLVKESRAVDTLMLYKGTDEADFLKKFTGFSSDETPAKEDAPLSFQDRLEACEKCAGASKKKYPFGSGKNGLFLILNSPRLLTETEMKVFRQDSVELMKKMITAMDLIFEECYITNLIKCDHNSPLLKPSQMIGHCLEFVAEEIEQLDPCVILVMGDQMPLQDVMHSYNRYSWYHVNHPVTLVKNPDMKKEAWETMKLVMAALRKKQ